MKTVGIVICGDKSGGGVYQYTQSLVQALSMDHSRRYVLFCTPDDNRFTNSNLELRFLNNKKSNILIKFIRFICLSFFIRSPLFFSKQEKKLYSDIDLFISPAITAYPHFYLNKPFIFTLHDMQEKHFPQFFTVKERLIRALVNRALAYSAARIICESEFVKQDIVLYTKTNPGKIKVIQSPPDTSFLSFKFIDENAADVRRKYNLPQKYLFYPAQYWPHKNHERLLEAFKTVSQKYNDVFLVLSGSKQNYFQQVQKKITTMELQDKVIQLGYIDFDDMPYIYRLSLMLVMPSLYESISIPVYEAFSLGVPVCCSNVVALPEQVGNAGLLFDPFDVGGIAEKIITYISCSEIRNKKAMMGFEKIENFSHGSYKTKLNAVLEETGC